MDSCLTVCHLKAGRQKAPSCILKIQHFVLIFSYVAIIGFFKGEDIGGNKMDYASIEKTAREIFIEPKVTYSYDEIVKGVCVTAEINGMPVQEKMLAVNTNTFRVFKHIESPKEQFIQFLTEKKDEILQTFAGAASSEALDGLAEKYIEALKGRLHPNKSEALNLDQYNAIRKPLDLYFEHIAAMCNDLSDCREKIVPLLRLPIDSQILNCHDIFGEDVRRRLGLNAVAGFTKIARRDDYFCVQKLAKTRADSVSRQIGQPFHCIYWDLYWSKRYEAPCRDNLFTSNFTRIAKSKKIAQKRKIV
jgi:hypothetical protein